MTRLGLDHYSRGNINYYQVEELLSLGYSPKCIARTYGISVDEVKEIINTRKEYRAKMRKEEVI